MNLVSSLTSRDDIVVANLSCLPAISILSTLIRITESGSNSARDHARLWSRGRHASSHDLHLAGRPPEMSSGAPSKSAICAGTRHA